MDSHDWIGGSQSGEATGLTHCKLLIGDGAIERQSSDLAWRSTAEIELAGRKTGAMGGE